MRSCLRNSFAPLGAPAVMTALMLLAACGAPLPEGTAVGDAPADGSEATRAETSGTASTDATTTMTTPSGELGTGSPLEDTGETTSGATATTSAGADSEAPTSSTDGVAVCGDGMIDPSEDCDDMNANELDGCTSACAVGPTGLAFGPASATEDMGGDDRRFFFDGDTDCPAGEVLVGLSGGLVEDEDWIGTARGRCATVDLTNADPPALVTAPGTALPQYGIEDGGGPWEVLCPHGQLLVGAEGQGGSVLDRLLIYCATPAVVQGGGGQLEIQLGPGAAVGPVGNDGGDVVGPIACGDGEIATGLHLSTGSYVVRLALRCRAVQLAY